MCLGSRGQNCRHAPPSTTVRPRPSATTAMPSSGLQPRRRVEVARARRRPRSRGRSACPCVAADDALDHHRHLLLLEPVRRRAQVVLGAARERGGVHELDRGHQLAQPLLERSGIVGQHERVVHAGERLVLRVLEQAGTAHGERPVHALEEHRQALDHLVPAAARRGSARRSSSSSAHSMANAEQVVAVEELVEQVGGQHHGLRHADLHAREAARHAVVVEQEAHERQPARLAAQRAAAQAREEVRRADRTCRGRSRRPASRPARGGTRRSTRAGRAAGPRGVGNSATLRGRSLRASANSVRAVNQREKWLRWPW